MSDEMVSLTIDGQPIEVPKGTLIIRAAEQLGIHIPRFCDHPLLKPAGACRQCMVEVAMPGRDGKIAKMPKPQASCTMVCTPGMEVYTQYTSPVAKKAQEGQLEFLLINHPLDCPICDKGGECPLQNQSMSHGTLHTRFSDVKRTWPKPVALTSQILLDRDRCVLCQRCVRFAKEIAGDAFIDLQGRGGGTHRCDDHDFLGENIGGFDTHVLGVTPSDGRGGVVDETMSGPTGEASLRGNQDVGPVGADEQDAAGNLFGSYFSGNVIQICPVGALTSKDYRFRARPFDLTSTRGVTEHDASGSVIRTDIRRGQIVRRMAQRDMDVNEEWITDKDRFAFAWQHGRARLTSPLVREDGQLVATSWADALDRAARGIEAARGKASAALPGGRLSFEDAFAWSRFARAVLATNSIDQRTRPAGSEEESFVASHVAGTGLEVTYGDLEKAGQVLLVGFDAEDECGSVFLRLRKGHLAGTVSVAAIAPVRTPGLVKMGATWLSAVPGTEPDVVASITTGAEGHFGDLAEALAQPGAVIVVGERAGSVPGLLSAVAALRERTGARLAWIPRRAGERGGVEAGLLPALLPFGRGVGDAEARADLGAAWGVDIPAEAGLDTQQILAAAKDGQIGTLVVGGVDHRDLVASDAALDALRGADFVISLEVNATAITEVADVVFPVAPPAEKPGTFINWEGRLRPFGQALTSRAMSDREVLARLADELGYDMAMDSLRDLHDQANEVMDWDGQRAVFTPVAAAPTPAPQADEVVLACHKPMLDDGLTQAGADDLAASARKPVARMSARTIELLGLSEGSDCTIQTTQGSVTLPLVAADMADRVVWVPECSIDSHVHADLGVSAGAFVRVLATTEVNR
ncbi:NADH-quinone oxidoreductase subunit G [Nanchangia anserum]|uniref:NADH-quinone oxidoreductase subunit G n=1 Tax=Nanchangia anserum TaxID=2692125 RepID=A0A8I0GFZ2_9ACTO|nr:NADH-quinone oxidoreductase subunit G [Nanchangia anserum]MBD3689329.1 NADH-quinone oxidoreductase subunit G [Nanchangia anserum]